MTKNKVALITGASSGIGKEIALQLAKHNITVCLNFSKSKKAAKEVSQEIKKFGGQSVTYEADITKEAEIIKMFRFLLSKFGTLDYLINNAGVYAPSLIEKCKFDDWRNIIDVNLYGKLLCTKYAIPLLKKSKNPRIINIASRSAIKPSMESSAYCCAAAAIIMLTKASALELENYNIKVNTVSPGLTRTPLAEKFSSKKEFDDYAERNPSKRVGTTSDIAQAVLFLISEKADFINGENINVSGGILLK